MTRETQSVTEPTKPMLRRAVSAAAIGNAVEWFDYSIYAYGATTIARVLFPDGENSLFLVLVGFAVSFLVRPLGRRRVLAVTILLMTAATVAVGLVPSYEQIGVVAPVVLYLLRMIQGLSTGGEYAGAATFIAEYARPDRPLPQVEGRRHPLFHGPGGDTGRQDRVPRLLDPRHGDPRQMRRKDMGKTGAWYRPTVGGVLDVDKAFYDRLAAETTCVRC